LSKITRFVLWLCKKFSRQELEQILGQLEQILSERGPEIAPRDDFRQQHPHYRDFYVDPQAPLTQSPKPLPASPPLDWQQLCATYQKTHHRPLAPVQPPSPGLSLRPLRSPLALPLPQ
jgi:hypothetical protein